MNEMKKYDADDDRVRLSFCIYMCIGNYATMDSSLYIKRAILQHVVLVRPTVSCHAWIQ